MNDIKKTQHFTDNYNLILKNIKFKPEKAIDPFAGNCDLKKYSEDTEWEFYDIEPKKSCVIKRDTLLNPPDYEGKTIITNPPYLAKNQTKKFKEIFDKYNVDDLYKAAILSVIGCDNGILIIPVNFFTDEYSSKVRKSFLSLYKVSYVNFFTYKVFENTSYNVCSFYFEKGETNNVIFNDIANDNKITVFLDKNNSYRIGEEFYNLFKNIKPVFFRALKKDIKKNFKTYIQLQALDNNKNNIRLFYNEEIYYGICSDRTKATLCCNIKLSIAQQKKIIDNFNYFINFYRNKYNNLILTNYRDRGRKRISFDDVYKICTLLIDK